MQDETALPPEQFWSGSFGDSYTERNQVAWAKRIPFWSEILKFINPAGYFEVMEVGCNAGWNLLALTNSSQAKDVDVYGVDINDAAIEQAHKYGLDQVSNARAVDVGLLWPVRFDLVFTAGVLIHVPPEDLQQTMQAIVHASKRWVLAVEYEDQQEREIPYRGHAGKLWRRPFGEIYKKMGLTERLRIERAKGFDNCTAWLMEKGL